MVKSKFLSLHGIISSKLHKIQNKLIHTWLETLTFFLFWLQNAGCKQNFTNIFYGYLQNAAEQPCGVCITAHHLVCSLKTLCGINFLCAWQLWSRSYFKAYGVPPASNWIAATVSHYELFCNTFAENDYNSFCLVWLIMKDGLSYKQNFYGA